LEQLHLPDDFILYQGPGGQRQIEILVQAWHWCTGAVGEYYPLLVIGLDERDQQTLSEWIEILDFGDTLRIMPGVTPDLLPQIYQLSTAVFHPATASPWCGPVRLSLGSGKPLVAAEHDLTAAITGSAAYLGSATDARALGAALVTVVVEEQVARRLSAAAEQRVQNWKSSKFGSRLGAIYTGLSQAG
jgi:glycosyltransferase involved in cell wall biosynthesis